MVERLANIINNYSGLKIVENFPLSELKEDNLALVIFNPKDGPYVGKNYYFNYIVPSTVVSDIIGSIPGPPTKSLLTMIWEILPKRKLRFVENFSEEHNYLFTKAIDENKGTIIQGSDGHMIPSIVCLENLLDKKNS